MNGFAPIQTALAIEPEESRPVALMMTFGVFIGFARTLVHTSAYGLFLESRESSDLPLVYLPVAVIAGTVSTLYLRLGRPCRFSPIANWQYSFHGDSDGAALACRNVFESCRRFARATDLVRTAFCVDDLVVLESCRSGV
ncbi:MAG: hypothetical protein ACREXX_11275 [Gammaproteobacteria bacterium]